MSRSLREKHWPAHPALGASISLRVPFQDADPTGVAWHGNYFRYYDAARVELLRRLQFGYRDMSALGQIWPIVDTRARYLRAIPFGSSIDVQVQLVEWEFRLRMYYEIKDAQGTLMNEAYTVQVPVDAKTDRLIIGTPESLQIRIAELLET